MIRTRSLLTAAAFNEELLTECQDNATELDIGDYGAHRRGHVSHWGSTMK